MNRIQSYTPEIIFEHARSLKGGTFLLRQLRFQYVECFIERTPDDDEFSANMFTHSIETGLLAALGSHKIDVPFEAARIATTAALYHDLAKLTWPSELLYGEDAPKEEHIDIIYNHPLDGVKMVRDLRIQDSQSTDPRFNELEWDSIEWLIATHQRGRADESKNYPTDADLEWAVQQRILLSDLSDDVAIKTLEKIVQYADMLSALLANRRYKHKRAKLEHFINPSDMKDIRDRLTAAKFIIVEEIDELDDTVLEKIGEAVLELNDIASPNGEEYSLDQ